jgi:hypothetical protein
MELEKHSLLIGISGKIKSGKDYSTLLIQALIANPKITFEEAEVFTSGTSGYQMKASGIEVHKFADMLKELCSTITGDDISLWNSHREKDAQLATPWHTHSRRSFMTDLAKSIREGMGDSFFAKALMSQRKPIGEDTLGMFDTNTPKRYIYPSWIIGDVRKDCEVKAVEDAGGLLIRVNRPLIYRHGYEALEDVAHEDPELHAKLHAVTETELDNHPFEYVIDWTDDGAVLFEKLKQILIKNKIING